MFHLRIQRSAFFYVYVRIFWSAKFVLPSIIHLLSTQLKSVTLKWQCISKCRFLHYCCYWGCIEDRHLRNGWETRYRILSLLCSVLVCSLFMGIILLRVRWAMVLCVHVHLNVRAVIQLVLSPCLGNVRLVSLTN